MRLGIGLPISGVNSGADPVLTFQVSPGTTKEMVLSNRCSPPYTTFSSASHVRWSYLKCRASTSADFSGVRLRYVNWGQNSTSEFAGETSITIDAAIEYNGTIYRGTYNGSNTLTLAQNTDGYLDIPGLTIPAGATFYVLTKYVGQVGTINRLTGYGTLAFTGEGSISASSDSTDYFTTTYKGSGCTYTVNLTAGSISSVTRLTGGSGYSASGQAANLYAWEVQSNGTIAQKVVGYITASAGAVTGFVITSGAPPAGATWTNPQLSFGNLFQTNSESYGPALITGTPNVATKALLLVGDSIGRGWSSSDSVGDLNRNFGIFERSIANICGVANVSSSGAKASYHANPVIYPKTYALYAPYCTHALVTLGTNDIRFDSRTKTQLQSDLTTIASRLRGYGVQVAFSTILPQTTSTDSWATVANQTEVSGFASGGAKELHNADLRSGAFPTDYGYVDMDAVFRDGTTTTKWRADLTAAATGDGTHPSLTALAYAQSSGPTYRLGKNLVVAANNTNFCDHLSSYTGANWIFRSITRHKAGDAGYTNNIFVYSNTVGGITTETVIAHTYRVEAWVWTESNTTPIKMTFNGGASYAEFTGGVKSQAKSDAVPGLTIAAGENVYVKTLAYATDSGAAGTYTWYGNIQVKKTLDSYATTANAFLGDETPGLVGSPWGGKLSQAAYSSGTTGVASISVTAQGQGYPSAPLYSLWFGAAGATVPGAKYKGVHPSGGYINLTSGRFLNLYVGTSVGWAYDSANMPYAYGGYSDYFGHGPVAIFGNPVAPAYSPIIFGDSWTAGNNGDPDGLGVIYEYVFGKPSAKVATNGNSLRGFLNNQTTLKSFIQTWASWGVRFSHILCAHGVNDFRLWSFAADYGANLKADQATFKSWCQAYYGSTPKSGIVTVPPSTTSTDGWSSLANQTPYVYVSADQYRANGPVILYNADVRTGAAPRDFYIDLAAKVSDPSYPHLWRVDCYDTVGSAALMCSDTQNSASDSVTFGTGSKTFTVGTNKLYSSSQYVEITDGVSGNKMRGNVTGYNNSTGVLTVNVTYNGGAGTSSAWTIKAIGRTTTDGIHLSGTGYQWAIDNKSSELRR